MSTVSATPKKTYELVAILLLLPALYIELRWFIVSFGNSNLSAEARNETFLEAFPFMESTKVLLVICLACAVMSIVFASKSFNQRKIVWRVSSFIVVLIGSLIALLSIFQMVL